MKNIAIVVDSSCGLTKEQAHKLGWHYLPLKIELDDKIYNDGDNLKSNELFKYFSLDTKQYKTACTPIGVIEDMVEELSKTHDYVVVFPISQHLSSQYQNIKGLESLYPKLRVFNSEYIAILLTFQVFRFLEFVNNQNMSVEEALLHAEKWDDNLIVSLVPKYNDYLVKGGRLSPSAATIAKLLKIVPVISFYKGKLEKEGKGRIFTKTIINKIDERLLDNDSDLLILQNDCSEFNQFVDHVKSNYPNNVYTSSLPNCISIHTGPEAIVIIKLGRKLAQKEIEVL
ncbi:DegV family protein [Mycoplasmopsis verecunda]|uniref:EDD domain protein, DegV family n=1 Tax=Mycoplasmopsis verecunda TaxID=171291 RepID=A0A1T4LHB3_9BACT|nr:DegV family protein [Mycoplasmopsis verecunda]WPB54610.1 DegV family protein [Mycoplasmopsis verecunda]SJZ54105.1 EDD domain protein, DegV family [Mycoplasmopsis verecunda]